jgi:hypothetical protein
MMKGVSGFLASFHYYKAYRKEVAKIKERDDNYVLKRFLYRRSLEKVVIKGSLYGCESRISVLFTNSNA